jgi:hypothetical protein
MIVSVSTLIITVILYLLEFDLHKYFFCLKIMTAKANNFHRISQTNRNVLVLVLFQQHSWPVLPEQVTKQQMLVDDIEMGLWRNSEMQ